MSNADELLTDIREAARRLTLAAKGDSNDAEIEAGHDVASAFEVLDDHLNAGGPLPADWDRMSLVLPSRADLIEAYQTAFGGGTDEVAAFADRLLAELVKNVRPFLATPPRPHPDDALAQVVGKVEEAGAHKTCGDPDCNQPEHDREWIKAVRDVLTIWDLLMGPTDRRRFPNLFAAIERLREVTPR